MMKMDGGGQQNGPGFGFVQAGLNFIVPVCRELAWKRSPELR